MTNKLLYSTEKGSTRKEPQEKPSPKPASGPCKMRLEHKGGKKVTILFNLSMSDEQAKGHMKNLQRQCACGGTFKNGMIELHGDIREAVERYFAEQGIKVKRAGG